MAIKETIHANGFDISIYTNEFQNEFLSLTDIAKYKSDENSRLSLNWNLNREISKLNYKIHTDAIKENLIPAELTPNQIAFTYANEADLLNVALFGMTAKQWRDTEDLISGILEEVKTGQEYADARAKSNVMIFNAWLNGQTGRYAYGELTPIANNAIYQYRDMYLRPNFYILKMRKRSEI